MFKVITICDLDYTLVDSNTTNELLKIVNCKKYLVLSKLLTPLSIIGLILKRDIVKQVLIKLVLYGISKAQLERFSSILYRKMEAENRINKRLLLIIRSLERYGPLILLSASISEIVREFKKLGFTCAFGSPTIYINEKLVGFYDMYRRKHEIVQEILSRYKFELVIIFDDSPEPELFNLCRNTRCRIYRVKFHETGIN